MNIRGQPPFDVAQGRLSGCPVERSEALIDAVGSIFLSGRDRAFLSCNRQHRARRVSHHLMHCGPGNMRRRFGGRCAVCSHHDQIDFELRAGRENSLGKEICSHDKLHFLLQPRLFGQTIPQLLQASFA